MPARCKDRERILASGVVDVPALPLGAVRGILCFRCFAPTKNLQKCGACRRVGYCSKECQKLDWTAVHKKQCKLLQQVNEIDSGEQYKDSRSWADYRRLQLAYLRTIQSHTEVRDTIFIIQAQAYCSTCRRSAHQLASRGIALEACKDCHLLHHCSGCADSHSKAVCATYQVQNDVEQFRIQLFEDTGKASAITITEKLHTTHKPLASCAGWYDYFVNVSDKASIMDKITPDFSQLSQAATQTGSAEREFEESRRMFLLLTTDTLTMPLTIISALESLSLTKKALLTIHLLGATGREFLAMPCFEEISHLLPSLNNLAFTMQDLPGCPSCKTKARKRTLSSYKGLYHDYAKSSFYKRPDLIVAFNSGCVDGDDADSDWDKTIRLIVNNSVPALFTTYNAREAQHERAKMIGLGAKFVVEPGENKWRSLAPMPEYLDEEYEMWYQNHHRYIIQGKQK